MLNRKIHLEVQFLVNLLSEVHVTNNSSLVAEFDPEFTLRVENALSAKGALIAGFR
jgi:hypothetical protein